MTIDRTLRSRSVGRDRRGLHAGPALAQACTREGADVTCDDGRRGMLSGDAIIWPDGTRSSLIAASQRHHRQQIVGDRRPGRVRRPRQGVVPLDNPSAPNKPRCAVLDGVSYCY